MTPVTARASSLTACAALAGLLSAVAWAADPPKKAATPAEDAEQHVTLAEKTFENFWLDPGQDSFRRRLSTAQGVLIIPISARIGFIVAGQGGRGVLVTRDASSGKWGGPAFYTLSYASLGLQVGVQVSEVIILAMTQNAVNSLLSSSVRGGVDAAIAGGPVGTGAQTSFQGDFLGFYRSKVAYAGLNVNGAVISSNDSWNTGFYGKPTNTADILVRHDVSNPKGEALVNQVSAAAAEAAEQQKTAAAEKPAAAKDEKK